MIEPAAPAAVTATETKVGEEGTKATVQTAEVVTTDSSRVPRPASHKIAVGSIAGAFTIVLVWTINKFFEIEIPAEVAQAITMLGATGLSFLVPDDMEAP